MKFFALVTLMLSLTAHGATDTTHIKFGALGPSLQSHPSVTSARDAKALYEKLDLPMANSVKRIEASDGTLQCADVGPGRRKAFVCEIKLKSQASGALIAQSSGAATAVHFAGELAKEIFLSLNVATTLRVGSNERSLGNVSCSLGSRLNPMTGRRAYRCSLTRVSAWQTRE